MRFILIACQPGHPDKRRRYGPYLLPYLGYKTVCALVRGFEFENSLKVVRVERLDNLHDKLPKPCTFQLSLFN